jgi:hypothetical protein
MDMVLDGIDCSKACLFDLITLRMNFSKVLKKTVDNLVKYHNFIDFNLFADIEANLRLLRTAIRNCLREMERQQANKELLSSRPQVPAFTPNRTQNQLQATPCSQANGSPMNCKNFSTRIFIILSKISSFRNFVDCCVSSSDWSFRKKPKTTNASSQLSANAIFRSSWSRNTTISSSVTKNASISSPNTKNTSFSLS